MNSDLDVYKFSVDILENNINSVLINHKNYKSATKQNILNENEEYINELRNIVNKLKFNISNLDSNNSNNIEVATRKLRDVIANESKNIVSTSQEAKSLLKKEEKVTKYEDLEGFEDSILELKRLYDEVCKCNDDMNIILSTLDKYNHSKYENESISLNNDQKKLDVEEYKKLNKYLNTSFWEARQKAHDEEIKYPSALYEKMVKEYQNSYLIENYNISLQELEDAIEEYKEKYFDEVYMEEIYEKALVMLKSETTLSMQELCDESCGLCLLDKKAYEILQSNLDEVIKEIRITKQEENIEDSLDVNKYKKSLKLNDLINKKDVIDRQLYAISLRANVLESSLS